MVILLGTTVVNLISSSSYDYFEKQVQDFYNKYELDNTISCDFKVGNNNKLTPDGIDKIVSIYENRTEIEYYSHLADYEEIKKAKFDLSVSTYVKSKGNKKKIDIDSLNLEIDEIVDEENKL